MLKNEIGIPEGLEVTLEDDRLRVKGEKGEISKIFKHPRIRIKHSEDNITLVSDVERKKVKAMMGTWRAIINNMFLGLKRGWKGELKLVYSHFPVKLRLEENTLVIENFLGEKNTRTVSIPDDLKVEIDKNCIYVSGADKERVGQLSTRIEQITKVRGYDRRVFQDGIYITRKPYLEEENEGKEGTEESQG